MMIYLVVWNDELCLTFISVDEIRSEKGLNCLHIDSPPPSQCDHCVQHILPFYVWEPS